MSFDTEADRWDWQAIVRGECEAELLDQLQSDCYTATSGNMAAGNRGNMLYRPIADELRVGRDQPRPVWPGNARFAVCLTHDVDQVSRRNLRMHWRRLKRQGGSLLRGFESRAWRGFQASASHLAKSLVRRGTDPLHCYERWLEIESEVEAKSTFLFLPGYYGSPHYTDGSYRYDDRIVFDGQRCRVDEMMREMHRRGWEVGLHASWNSSNDLDEMRHQKDQVEQAIDAQVVSVRHHHLHCDIRHTPRVHHKAGLRFDSSFGMNDNIGFRHGTSYPTRLVDMSSGEPLDLWEVPLAIQDRALVETLGGGSEELALDWARLLSRRVEDVGGVLTLLWHPECIQIDAWMNVYCRLLKLLKEQGAWFGTMNEIGEWWREHNHFETNLESDTSTAEHAQQRHQPLTQARSTRKEAVS